jgi:hypothetical protein
MPQAGVRDCTSGPFLPGIQHAHVAIMRFQQGKLNYQVEELGQLTLFPPSRQQPS